MANGSIADILILYVLSTLFYAFIIFLIAVGLNLIYGVMRLLNLTHTSLFTLGAYMAAWISTQYLVGTLGADPLILLGVPPLIAVLFVVVVALTMVPLLRYSYGKGEELQLILTFGLLLIFEDFFQLAWGRTPMTSSETFLSLGSIPVGGFRYPLYNIYVVLVGVVLALMVWVLIFKTRTGMLLRAVSMDAEMSSAIGANVGRTILLTIILGSALAGLGGALYLPAAAAQLGLSVEMLVVAFVVMVIGGLGSIYGSLLGALVTASLRTLALAFFPELELAILYLAAVLVFLFKPEGIAGGR